MHNGILPKRVPPGDILQIAKHDPVVSAMVEHWKRGEFFSWEDMLAQCVIAMATRQLEEFTASIKRAEVEPTIKFDIVE